MHCGVRMMNMMMTYRVRLIDTNW